MFTRITEVIRTFLKHRRTFNSTVDDGAYGRGSINLIFPTLVFLSAYQLLIQN